MTQPDNHHSDFSLAPDDKTVGNKILGNESFADATPVIAQYLEIKSRHKHCLLMFRMGDFYELFFDDAVTASGALNIVLTKRGKYNDQDIPMCGVPVHNFMIYTQKLVSMGYAVAVCEQLESPIDAKKRGAKSVVKRDVVRILTAGTLTEDNLLTPNHSNYILSYHNINGKISAMKYDMSTGYNAYSILDNADDAVDYIMRTMPAEILYTDHKDGDFLKQYIQNIPITYHDITYDTGMDINDYTQHIPQNMLDYTAPALILLLSYIHKTQKDNPFLFLPSVYEHHHDFLQIDASTLNNLEIVKNYDGNRQYSLLWVLDNMTTAVASRLLYEYITRPVTSIDILNMRYDAVDFFVKYANIADIIRQNFKNLPDISRIIGRIAAGRGVPADLGHLRHGLHIIYHTLSQCHFENYVDMPPLLKTAYQKLCHDFESYALLSDALMDNPPQTLKYGAFVRHGYDAVLDEYVNLRDNAQNIILSLEDKYRQHTDISSLKIKHNNIIGYHIDVPSSQGDKILNGRFDNITFIHKQTLANNMRFTSDELMTVEKKIFESETLFNVRESELFQKICGVIQTEILPLSHLCDGIAIFDLYASHAVLVSDYDYVRPVILPHKSFSVQKLRHCVIEKIFKSQSHTPFIPNDCHFLSHHKQKHTEILLLTGPNMGGKSTYLRQNALAIIIAQAGFFVPASSYHAGIFDKVFSRVGASDNLSRGQSTFMMEMSEMSMILKNATPHSFVILDEVGRGTSTHDGLAIAFSVTEYLLSHIRCLTIFATHYHEMTELTKARKSIAHLQVAISHIQDKIIFLHKMTHGAAKKSYGIHVAKLAGMPVAVIKTAQDFLHKLDKKTLAPQDITDTLFLNLFNPDDDMSSDNHDINNNAPCPVIAPNILPEHIQNICDILNKTDMNTTTPINALQILNDLKERAKGTS